MTWEKGSVLCVRFVIADSEAPKNIWKAHGSGDMIEGCHVTGISSTDLFAEVDKQNDLLAEICEYLQRHHSSDPEADALLAKLLDDA